MLNSHLPILLVVVPLLAAPLIVLLRRSLPSWIVATAASVATLAIALPLLQQAVSEGVISYAIGNWPPPLGIEYRVDAANAFVAVIVSLIGVFVMPYCRRGVAAEGVAVVVDDGAMGDLGGLWGEDL